MEFFPVLTPLAVDPGHPFPYISNLSLSLAVELREPETGIEHFARVKVPKSLPRWVPVRPLQYLPLEELIGAHLGLLFPGMEVTGSHVFRITRFSDLEIAPTEEPEDVLAMIEEQVFSGASARWCGWRCSAACRRSCARCCSVNCARRKTRRWHR